MEFKRKNRKNNEKVIFDYIIVENFLDLKKNRSTQSKNIHKVLSRHCKKYNNKDKEKF